MQEGILKKISYEGSAYESVDERAYFKLCDEKRRKQNPATNGLRGYISCFYWSFKNKSNFDDINSDWFCYIFVFLFFIYFLKLLSEVNPLELEEKRYLL